MKIKRVYEKPEKDDGIRILVMKRGKVTLVYGAKDEEHNEALVLKGLFSR
jgi:uncharacterized protein YeaO (DUF488 family)